ncbi:MAG TPA: hypothetical protein VFP72_21860 [Kineosporiaceae bacterium]|nr:hypothetical protein [Kineosporiaceae bacterium]
MDTDELRLSEALDAIARQPTPPAFTGESVLAGQRARRRRHLTLAAAAVGVSVLAPLAVGKVHQPEPSRPSSRLQLIAALTATDQVSYHIHLVNTGQFLTSPRGERVDDFTGVYDPTRRIGAGVNHHHLSFPDNPSRERGGTWDMELRFIGDTMYTQPRLPGVKKTLPWMKDRGSFRDAVSIAGGAPEWGPWDGASPGGDSLLTSLKTRGSVTLTGTQGTGASAVDTYTFSYDRPDDGAFAAEHVTGTVDVHHDSGLIARFTVQTTAAGHIEQVTIRWTITVTLSDYGLPVNVVPPADVVERGQRYTGATPTAAPATP